MTFQGWIGDKEFKVRAKELLARYHLPLKKPMTVEDDDEARWLALQWDMLNDADPNEAFGIKHEYANFLKALVRQTDQLHTANSQ